MPGKPEKKQKEPEEPEQPQPELDPAEQTAPAPEQAAPTEQPQPEERRMLVVGLGASAGGLAALKRVMQAMPPDSGMAFVVIQHLDPQHESLMASLLSQHTAMQVAQATEGSKVEPNCVYTIPPGTTMTIQDGLLRLRKPQEPRGLRLPIDAFFTSLAEDQEERAVGIVLSGTASDGTEGIRDIKAHGGLAVVQKPEDAEHDWMPRSAIGTGLVDLILVMEEMPEALLGYQRHPYLTEKVEAVPPEEGDALAQILALVNARLGHDFRGYRKTTLLRRIHRRMGFKRIQTLANYRDHLRSDPNEVSALFTDFLIGVTKFFREPEAWEALKQHVARPLIEREGQDVVRAWVPGCSTGKEPYSLAMTMLALAEELGRPLDLQIFATDIDPEALAYARTAVYPADIAEEVPAPYLEKYFTREENGYRVVKAVREVVVVAPQNALSDPPFSKLDLVSCRNLLIYLEPEIQDQLIKVFHFALRPDGFLFLGSSESVGPRRDLFEPVVKEHRIYRKVGRTRAELLELPMGFRRQAPGAGEAEDIGRAGGPPADAGEAARATGEGEGPRAIWEEEPGIGATRLAENLVLEQYAPASVLLNAHDEIIYYVGHADQFLRQPRGEPTPHVLSRLQEPLRDATRAALQQARGSGHKETVTSRLLRGGHGVRVDVHAVPLKTTRERDLLLLVLQDFPEAAEAVPQTASVSESEVIHNLEQELRTSRQDMSATVEELESSNEELTASNEEIVSMNEELQSTNEELETSREELQSLNEELRTVNSESQEKVEQLEQATNDVENLLRSTNIATIFLDRNLRLKRFTPPVGQLFNLLSGDVGRPISDLSLKLDGMDLTGDARKVMETLQPLYRPVRGENGRLYIHGTQLYRNQENVVEGVVLTFVDVTELGEAQAQIREQVEKLSTIMQVTPVAILVAEDPAGRTITGNPRAYELFRMSEGANLAESKVRFQRRGQEISGEDFPLRLAARTGEPVILDELDLIFEQDGGVTTVLGSTMPVRNQQGAVTGAVAAFLDITERRRVEAGRDRLAAIVEASKDAIVALDPEGVITAWNLGSQVMYGHAASEMIGQPYLKIVPESELAAARRALDEVRREGASTTVETSRQRKDGSLQPVSVVLSAITDEAGKVSGISAIGRDITAWQQAVGDLHDLTGTLEQRVADRTAQLQTAALEVTQAEQRERQRLAQLLHDGLQQTLAALKFKAQFAVQQAPEELQAPLGEVIAGLDGAIADTRSLSVELSPPLLHEQGLVPALEWLGESMRERHGLSVQTELDAAAEPEDEMVRTFLFDAARELLFNVVKHSGVQEARISLQPEGDDALTMAVSDEGRGFAQAEAEERKGSGYGLYGVRQRAALLSGRLKIESSPDAGTRISICMPRGEIGSTKACAEGGVEG